MLEVVVAGLALYQYTEQAVMTTYICNTPGKFPMPLEFDGWVGGRGEFGWNIGEIKSVEPNQMWRKF